MASTHLSDHESVDYGSAHVAPAPAKSVVLAPDDPRIWGWHHQGNGNTARKAGLVVAVILLLMMLGNHHGHVEDLWLTAIAATLVLMVLVSLSHRRKSAWRK